MDVSLFFRFLLPLLSLMAAFFLVRKFRSTIRGFVIWCIPVHLRISEQSYQLQTRYATLASFLLTFLFAALFYYGLYQGQKALGLEIGTPLKTYSVLTPLPKKPLPVVLPKKEVPKVSPSVVPVSAIPKVGETASLPVQITTPSVAPKPISPSTAVSVTPKPLAAQYFVQVAAYTYLDNAMKRQVKWQHRTTQQVWIAVAQEPTPYKLVVGPFATKRMAQQYRKQQRASSFVRSGVGLQFFTK